MAKKHMKRCSTSLIIREMQTAIICHLILVRMVINKKYTNSKCWKEGGEEGIHLLCWWECKLLESLSEKAMAPHSSTLAWQIPWMEAPGRLQSMGLLGVGHDWETSLSLFPFMHWRRKWQPTPVFLPGESQGRGSLVGCYLWGLTELDTTEVT